MLDIKFVRTNPDAVKENIKKKFQDEKLPLVDEVISLDAENRKAKQEGDDASVHGKRLLSYPGGLCEKAKAKGEGYAGISAK